MIKLSLVEVSFIDSSLHSLKPAESGVEGNPATAPKREIDF
jgi:hypothetical protein